MFIERTFTKKDKQLGDQIITDIRSEFAENFKNLDWMSDQAKEIATKKGKYLDLKLPIQMLPFSYYN